ncbi:MAG: flippase-like domain-containing protein [Nitrospinae bacterium]|nr:flippase-like domain-containing protein [Nitrospinota bacterium]
MGSQKRGFKSYLLDAAKLLFVIVVFVFLYKSGKLDLNALSVALAKPGYVVISLFLTFLAMLISVERWRTLLRAVDISVDMKPALNLTLIGSFFNVVFPGAVGGDIVKAYYLARGQQNKAALVTTVVFDRVLGLYTMIFVAAVAGAVAAMFATSGEAPAWWNSSTKALVMFIAALFVAANLGALIFLERRISESRFVNRVISALPMQDKIRKIHAATKSIGRQSGHTIYAFFLSLLSQLALYGSIWILAAALNITGLSVGQYFFVLPVCLLINSIPVSPGGLGVGEMAFGAVFALFASNKGVELAVLYHAVSFALALGLGGLVYLVFSRRDNLVSITHMQKLAEQEEDN